jgi:FkbM family methyltransferase
VGVAGKTSIGRYFFEQAINNAMERTWLVRHGDVELSFAVPNTLNHFRIDTFSTKEPETLEWIDRIPSGSVLWDVGANVGLYTCYAAKARGCRVFAFEPSVFNLELLARNIFLNGITGQATIVPLPLNDALAISTLNMSSTEWGGALSSFGQMYSHDGAGLQKIFEFRTVGISMEDAVKLLKILPPDYIKMDVDGIEHLILKGGGEILERVKGVLVEINEEFEKQFIDSANYLTRAGLVMKEKRQSEMFQDSAYKNSYNQIWQRP